MTPDATALIVSTGAKPMPDHFIHIYTHRAADYHQAIAVEDRSEERRVGKECRL